MFFEKINEKYNLSAKKKYVYPIWLFMVIFLEVLVFVLCNIKKTPRIFSRLLLPIKDNWNWRQLIVVGFASWILGFVCLYVHYQPTLINQLIGKEKFPAWHFVKDSLLIYDTFGGLFWADHLFLFSGAIFGQILIWFCRVTETGPKVIIKKNTELNMLFASLVGTYLVFMGLVWDFSSFFLMFLYVLPWWGMWYSRAPYINFKGVLLLFAICTAYVVKWEAVNSWSIGWIYRVVFKDQVVHSVLFNSSDPLLNSSIGKPITIVFNYGWSMLFCLIPLNSTVKND